MIRFVKNFLPRTTLHAMILTFNLPGELAALRLLCSSVSPTGKPMDEYYQQKVKSFFNKWEIFFPYARAGMS
jgi:hypothetical protein